MEVKAKDAGGAQWPAHQGLLEVHVTKLPAMQMGEGTPRSGEVWRRETCLIRVRVCATAGAGSLSQTRGAESGETADAVAVRGRTDDVVM